mmetsp:Transcript_31486/g.59181  ORF Transcript_31486/g.59181 Transcript_31486/m.59181 type:complete len:236 (+) Transcript_31486:1894-2601(+)
MAPALPSASKSSGPCPCRCTRRKARTRASGDVSPPRRATWACLRITSSMYAAWPASKCLRAPRTRLPGVASPPLSFANIELSNSHSDPTDVCRSAPAAAPVAAAASANAFAASKRAPCRRASFMLRTTLKYASGRSPPRRANGEGGGAPPGVNAVTLELDPKTLVPGVLGVGVVCMAVGSAAWNMAEAAALPPKLYPWRRFSQSASAHASMKFWKSSTAFWCSFSMADNSVMLCT